MSSPAKMYLTRRRKAALVALDPALAALDWTTVDPAAVLAGMDPAVLAAADPSILAALDLAPLDDSNSALWSTERGVKLISAIETNKRWRYMIVQGSSLPDPMAVYMELAEYLFSSDRQWAGEWAQDPAKFAEGVRHVIQSIGEKYTGMVAEWDSPEPWTGIRQSLRPDSTGPLTRIPRLPENVQALIALYTASMDPEYLEYSEPLSPHPTFSYVYRLEPDYRLALRLVNTHWCNTITNHWFTTLTLSRADEYTLFHYSRLGKRLRTATYTTHIVIRCPMQDEEQAQMILGERWKPVPTVSIDVFGVVNALERRQKFGTLPRSKSVQTMLVRCAFSMGRTVSLVLPSDEILGDAMEIIRFRNSPLLNFWRESLLDANCSILHIPGFYLRESALVDSKADEHLKMAILPQMSAQGWTQVYKLVRSMLPPISFSKAMLGLIRVSLFDESIPFLAFAALALLRIVPDSRPIKIYLRGWNPDTTIMDEETREFLMEEFSQQERSEKINQGRDRFVWWVNVGPEDRQRSGVHYDSM